MKQRMPKIDGLSFAISRLVYLVADLLVEEFAAMKMLSPHEHVGLDLERISWDEGEVCLRITPRGWSKYFINASFYRGNRHGKGWNWNFGSGAIVALGAGTITGYEPMRDKTGRIVLGRVVEPARKELLTSADLAGVALSRS